MTLRPQPKTQIWIWFLWLGAFYAAWSYLAFAKGYWPVAVENWPIAVAMALGSYAAGSTPMGGGTVGFPVLVLGFDQPAQLGRDFSFAVQAIGMVSASILILARKQPLAWSMLRGALLGATVGTPLGIFFVAPFAPELWIKLLFAIAWGSFGILSLWRMREICEHVGMTEFNERWDTHLGFATGLVACLAVVSVAGVGVDMALYTVMVLVCRADLKIAIPTSVILMAYASLIGITTKLAFTGVAPGVFENWLAAAPVVALGAPLGVVVTHYLGRRPTLVVVAVLCVGQFVWTLSREKESLELLGIFASLLGLAACLTVYEALRKWGAKLSPRRPNPFHAHQSATSAPPLDPRNAP